MATKYKNPPIVYTTAKLIYAESIGGYSTEKYKKLLSALELIGFDAYTVSKIMGLQIKQSDNQFSAVPSAVDRVGYFSPNRRRCIVIDERTIELRLTEYDNHSRFLDDFKLLIELCAEHDIAKGNKLREVELNYVDIFVPHNCLLKDMFSGTVAMPMAQFYSDNTDLAMVGATNFTRILESGKSKVSVVLEQLNSVDASRLKYLPDTLVETDRDLSMPLDVERFFEDSTCLEYAIVHTACSSLVDMNQLDTTALRSTFEDMYMESRKTFDHMINVEVCDSIWKVERK
ncbi:hypothetical protein [Shewanella scandinavica]|uniref:hypothetical protein n=1 Tax=Shewanella scandinavica TaxID=3063538 RepID=UPI0030630328